MRIKTRHSVAGLMVMLALMHMDVLLSTVLSISPHIYPRVYAAEQWADAYSWLGTEKFRGSYFGTSVDFSHLQQLKEAGFNSAIVKFGSFNQLDAIEEWARAAAEAEIRFFPVLNFAGQAEVPLFRSMFDPVIDESGAVLERTPSPLDGDYWDRVINDRLEAIARLSLDVPITGVLIDTEMYGADRLVYSSDVIVNDEVFYEFIRDIGQSVQIDPADRVTWLHNKELFSSYESYLTERMRAIGVRVKEQVRRVNPQLMLGFLLVPSNLDNWIYGSLADGMGSVDNPVLVFTEGTYVSGYSERLVRQMNENVRKPHVVWVPGLWIHHFMPDQYAAHSYYLAVDFDGHWLYTSTSLARENEDLGSGHRLARPAVEYWQHLKLAHAELDVVLSDPTHVSGIQINESSTVTFAVEVPTDYEVPQLVPLNPDLDRPPRQSLPPTRLRSKSTVFIHVAPDEGLSIEMQQRSVGGSAQGTAFALAGPNGKEILKGEIARGTKRIIDFEEAVPGVYTLFVDPGRSSVEIEVHNAHTVYFAGWQQPISIVSRVRPLWFYVPETTREFGLHIRASIAEDARLVVHNAKGEVVVDEIINRERLFFFREDDLSGVWQMEISGGAAFFEDVGGIYLIGTVPPYLSDHPDRLLIPKQ